MMLRELVASAAILPRIAPGDIYDTATLLEVLYAPQNSPQLRGFWLKYFPRVINFDSEKIMFDELDQNEYRLAPFVSPNVQGRIIRSKGFQTRSFRPAYVKPKHVVDPSRTITRMAGEAPYIGSLSRQQRWDAIVADNLRIERQMIENVWDWMACQAIVTGKVTVQGEDYPTVTVDFQRDPSLTITNTGAALWTTNTATPIADIENARYKAFQLSRAPVNNLIFGLAAWAAFINQQHTDVFQLMNNQRYGNSDNLFNENNITDGAPFQYMGQMAGPGGAGLIKMWTYSNFYESLVDGSGQSYFDPGTVVGVGDAVQGIQAFGAIMDKGASLQPLSMFPKMWDVEDPSASYTMTQSAPLMIPVRPNNTFSIKVA